jgi:hypothetical protein
MENSPWKRKFFRMQEIYGEPMAAFWIDGLPFGLMTPFYHRVGPSLPCAGGNAVDADSGDGFEPSPVVGP